MYFISDERMLLHASPWHDYHLERPERLSCVLQRLKETGLLEKTHQLKARPASQDEIRLVHTEEYIAALREACGKPEAEREAFCATLEEVFVNEHSYELALLAAGSCIDATRAAYENGSVAFAAVRPPGHHASPGFACGFCLFNNVAITAKAYTRQYTNMCYFHARSWGARRVLIVDWDVHAGQGTQECIADDADILLISTHRYEHGTFWPNLEQSAVENKYRNTINVPLNAVGAGDADFLAAFHFLVLPVVRDFAPDLILVSCGFDAALGDPEGEMRLTPAMYARLTRLLMNTGIPVSMIFEGGYFLPSVAAGAEYVTRALLGEPIPRAEITPSHALPSLTSSLRSAMNRAVALHGFPTVAAATRLLGQMNNVSEHERQEPEYRGSRVVPKSWPTRDQYVRQAAEVERAFEEELNDKVKSYANAGCDWPTVRLEAAADFSCTAGASVLLKSPFSLVSVVEELIAKFVNPNYRACSAASIVENGSSASDTENASADKSGIDSMRKRLSNDGRHKGEIDAFNALLYLSQSKEK